MRISLNASYPRLTQCLMGILREEAHYRLPNANGEVELKEDDDGGNAYALQHVVLTGLPEHSVVIAADALKNTVVETRQDPQVWQNIDRYRHVSDYIVLFVEEGCAYFLYIEMKTSANSRKYIPQLRCARGQVEHLLYLIKAFDNEVFPDSVKHRFVKFYKMPPPRNVSVGVDNGLYGPDRPDCNDEPPKAYQCQVEERGRVDVRTLILQ